MVALRKESVDRNYAANAVDQILPGSLSARRAWIEILLVYLALIRYLRSLSARRAWIEIRCRCQPAYTQKGRSPQGERG